MVTSLADSPYLKFTPEEISQSDEISVWGKFLKHEIQGDLKCETKDSTGSLLTFKRP